MGFWDGRRVLVAGGSGFIGSHVVEELLTRAPSVRVTVAADIPSQESNLRGVSGRYRPLWTDLSVLENARTACRGQEVVLDLAGMVRGIGFNAAHPATMFRGNLAVTLALLDAARLSGAQRYLAVSTAAVYPAVASVGGPIREEAAGRGEPATAARGYAWAKIMTEFAARSTHEEFGLKIAIARLANTYGPRDHFDAPDPHVVCALIGRALAGEDPLRVLGDGSQTRSFIYVRDAARGLVDLAERYAVCDPVNLSASEAVSIRSLSELVRELCGSKARLAFERRRAFGAPHRPLDISKARRVIGFAPRVGLREGLSLTIDWFRRGAPSQNRAARSGRSVGMKRRVHP